MCATGARTKTVRSHLSSNDLATLASGGGRPAGPAPLPPAEPGIALEVERTISRGGMTSLGGRVVLAAEILGGRRVSIRIEESTLMFFDPETRELLRVGSRSSMYGVCSRTLAGPAPHHRQPPQDRQRRQSHARAHPF